MKLRDGRGLGYAEYGEAGGRALLYFHGWPGSRFEAGLLDGLARQVGVRVIAPDRPGYGLSDSKKGRRLMDWPDDVCELADHLGLGRFAVLGISGGGPSALACAAKIPGRISSALLVASVAPADAPGAREGMVALNRWLLSFAQTAPWLAERVGAVCLAAFWGKGQQVIPRQIEARLCAADRETLAHPEVRQTLIASSTEALRNGIAGAAADGLLLARPWGFKLEEIRVPVRLWHGEKDVVVPAGMGHYLARSIPGCQARFYPEDGHFSLPFGRMTEILGALS